MQLKHQNAQDTKNAKWIYADNPDLDATQVETWLSKALEHLSRDPLHQMKTSQLSNLNFLIGLRWEDGSEKYDYLRAP